MPTLNKKQALEKASRNSGYVGLVSYDPQRGNERSRPLHPLSLGNPASDARIQGTPFATNPVSRATYSSYVETKIE
jgi:hypothetical protein